MNRKKKIVAGIVIVLVVAVVTAQANAWDFGDNNWSW